jgi:hypothetical protein
MSMMLELAENAEPAEPVSLADLERFDAMLHGKHPAAIANGTRPSAL